jgi:hypothetical protein
MSTMKIPGFNAEASLYVAKHPYSTPSFGTMKNAAADPQLFPAFSARTNLPPGFEIPTGLEWDIPPGSGAQLPPSPTTCQWYQFCCLEFGRRDCCRNWNLHCRPE